jgi:hypothetical protein
MDDRAARALKWAQERGIIRRPSEAMQRRWDAQAAQAPARHARSIENQEFNRGVNTRQVRRQYARIMGKRGAI